MSCFQSEISALSENRAIASDSKIHCLTPFLNVSGMLRVGGRLANSDLFEERKHPLILSAKSQFVQLYAEYLHNSYFHAGARFLTSFLAHRFYVVGGAPSMVKRITYKCVICARFNRKPMSQLMGQLPLERVRASPPFTNVMVDFGGPFTVKCVGHRSVTFFEVHLCIFVCMAIHAVHLEELSAIKAEDFVHAIHRFVARRGMPSKLYSDSGPPFFKAKKILKIDWEFGPPLGPHRQGLVEFSVKSAKRSLSKVTKGHTLTFEELTTLFAQIEAVKNSRPLCRYGDGYLTPGHFLTGRHLGSGN